MKGRNIVLYVVMSVFLFLPQCVDVSRFIRLSNFWAILMVLFVWVKKLGQGW